MDKHALSRHVVPLLTALQVSINDICYSTRDGMSSPVHEHLLDRVTLQNRQELLDRLNSSLRANLHEI